MRPLGGFWGAVIAAQCAAIAFLVYQSLPRAAAPAVAPFAAPAPAPAVNPPQADDQRLRQIIREELAAFGAPGAVPAAVGAMPRGIEADRTRREAVAEQIERYRSAGRISETEMARLQNDIAQLDPASRREMLGQLVRAMNAREIQGQL
jgi:hypothetical protein